MSGDVCEDFTFTHLTVLGINLSEPEKLLVKYGRDYTISGAALAMHYCLLLNWSVHNSCHFNFASTYDNISSFTLSNFAAAVISNINKV
jgi:inner membrane protein involved in colicin E2 resistance